MTESRIGKVHIVGIGDDGLTGLTERAREIVRAADVLFGSAHSLVRVGQTAGEQIVLGADPGEVIRRIDVERTEKRMVVLASGDPLFYGVARYLCDRLGKDTFDVLPHVSSMQLAFARVKESWEDAYLTSLSGRSLDDVIDRIRSVEKVGVFTTDEVPANALARELVAAGVDYFRAYVCENLGSPDERVTQGDLAEIADMHFAPLNVVVLVRKPGRPERLRDPVRGQLFGNPDDSFAQSRPKSNLITQAEVRAIALAQMNIRPDSLVWDIGAGTGSVAIEAAQLARSGRVYAVEKDAEDFARMRSNAERFGVPNLTAICGRAPEAFRDLPDPDAIFVGATGRELAPLLVDAYSRLRRTGRIVVNVATLETLQQTWSTLKELEREPSVWMVQISRGTHQLGSVRFDALAPTFLLALSKS